MDKVNVNLLRFLAHYDYLDFDSHDLKDGEQELNNTKYENNLYCELFNQLVEPQINEFRAKGLVEDQIIFNFFCRSDQSDRMLITFYKPDCDYEVLTDDNGNATLVNSLLMLPKINC